MYLTLPRQRRQAGYQHLPFIVAFIVMGVLGAVAYRVVTVNRDADRAGDSSIGQTVQPSRQPNGNGTPMSFADQYKDLCKDRKVNFTSGPMPASQLSYIEPLGKVNDGHVTPTDHVYVHGADFNAGANAYDAIMPADGTVIDISAMPDQYIGDRNQQTASEDHRLVISHSCRYYSIYIHVHKLDPVLQRAVGDLAPNQNKRVSVELKAGDKLGKVGGGGFDWTPIDTNKKLAGLITPELYQGESWKIHTVSPFDLYSGQLKRELEAKSLRTVAPLGGKIDWDQRGRLIGNWFRQGSGGYSGQNGNNEGRYWDGHLSIAPDYIDGKTTVVSIGNWGGKAQQLAAKTTVNPASVSTNSGPVKIELTPLTYTSANGQSFNGQPTKGMTVSTNGPTAGTILVEVQKGEKLKVETFVGKTADQVSGFSEAAMIYER